MRQGRYTQAAQTRGGAAVGLGDSFAAVGVLVAVLVTAAVPVVVASGLTGAASAVAVRRLVGRARARRRTDGRDGPNRPPSSTAS